MPATTWWQGARYEPTRVYGWIVALLQAGSAFGLDLTAEQRYALLGLVVATLALVEAIRGKVTPTAKLDDQQWRSGAPRMAANPGEGSVEVRRKGQR